MKKILKAHVIALQVDEVVTGVIWTRIETAREEGLGEGRTLQRRTTKGMPRASSWNKNPKSNRKPIPRRKPKK